ncbi:MAG: hypothetical protein KTR31_30190 [Myxococcales bacterium]|nr:hypothetical protein [Myxococcales bacterium]
MRPALVMLLAACADPSSGTFVGNPSMNARLIDNDIQHARGGQLDALEVHVTDCDDPPLPLGPTTFFFDGAESEDSLGLPIGEHCGLFFVVDRFTVRFDEGDEVTTLVSDGFDLEIGAGFAARWGQRYRLHLGDTWWLEDVASLAEPGTTFLNSEEPELQEAFLEGLMRSTVVEQEPR